jgi:heat shock protein HslJ
MAVAWHSSCFIAGWTPPGDPGRPNASCGQDREIIDLRQVLRLAVLVIMGLGAVACASSRDGISSPTDSTGGDTAPPLAGSSWRLASIDGRDPLAGADVTAKFEDDDRVAGKAACNQYFGRAAVKGGGQLDVGALGSTKMFCTADGVMQLEDAYLTALGKVKFYRVVGDELRLGPTASAVTLVFKRQ